jgi:hypothetical protein
MTWYHNGGDANLKAQVYDGTNVIAEQVLAAHTSFGVQQFMLFTCPSSGTIQPRFISTANAAIAYFDEVRIGQEKVFATNVVDYPWTSYTPTLSAGWGAATGVSFFHSRVGDKLLVKGTLTPAPAASLGTISLPGSLQIDSGTAGLSNTDVQSGPKVGTAASAVSANQYALLVTATGTSSSVVYLGNAINVANKLTPTNVSTVLPAELITVEFSVPIEGWAEQMPDQAISVEKSGWYIDAQLGGTNPVVSTVATSSYTEITDAGLDMVLNTGSASAQIPCSSTNPSTGLTCAAGSESIGVAFTPPTAGVYEVCANVNGEVNEPPGTGYLVTLQWVETPNNAQTILQEGGGRQVVGDEPSAGSVSAMGPGLVCGQFTFSNTSQRTLRLMFESYYRAGSAANYAKILMDRDASAGQRDMKVTVRRKIEYNDSIKFTNMVTTNHQEGERIERVFFAGASSTTACSSSPCTVYSQSGSWISSVTRNSTGNYTLNIAPGTFTSAPVCTCSGSGDINGSSICNILFSNVSTTSVNMTNTIPGSGAADQGDHLVCMGSK